MRFVRTISTVLLGTAMATVAIAQTTITDVTRSAGKVSATRSVATSADITAIDPATRGLTLRGVDGKQVELTAGPEVRNYDKLKVGDKVDMSYIERLDLELIKGGGKPVVRTEDGAEARAAEGEAPAGVIAARITTVGDVTAINAETQEVTLKGPEQTVTLKVEDAEQFKLIAVGDQIQATLTAAVAISATTPGAPAAE